MKSLTSVSGILTHHGPTMVDLKGTYDEKIDDFALTLVTKGIVGKINSSPEKNEFAKSSGRNILIWPHRY